MYRIRTGGRKGSALVVALITAVVLSILVGALFMLFKANVASYEWQKEDLQAMYTAEAGTRLATFMILDGTTVPQDTTTQFLPPSGNTWFDLPGENLGETLVYVDPHHDNGQITSANAYGVRALGRIVANEDAYTYGMETLIMPENFARFSCFQNLGFQTGYYSDGYRFDGPFHSNGSINIFSENMTSLNDPYFYSLSIARRTGGDGYYYGQSAAGGVLTTSPKIGNLEIQPYQRMLMGPPYFDMHADSIPYGPTEVNWQAAYNAAVSGGLYFDASSTLGELADGSRISISHDTLRILQSNGGPISVYACDSLVNPVVWIDNAPTDRIFIRQYRPLMPNDGLDIPLTIGMNGDLYCSGNCEYSNTNIMDPNNNDMLGLITVHGDIIIANDESYSGDPEWTNGFQILTDGSFNFDAVFMALDGDIHAEDYHHPDSLARSFEILGGYIAQNEGPTSTSSSGFEIVITYDTRLMTKNPPYFPSTGQWNTVFWEDRPDLDIHNIKEDRY